MPHESYPWLPDRGDGTFQNPVLFADYSDPDVVRAGDRYYLTASSFAATPGLPILESPDLVNWTLVAHALENLPDRRYEQFQPGAGIWAPSLREHAGKFYLFAPTPDEGIYVLEAPHPRGPWTPPRLLLSGKGLIDPCPFWDDDGKAYLVHAYARSRAGIKDRLRVRPMAPDTSAVLGEGDIIYHDPEQQPTLEGPKLYKRNGYYYILAPAGGVPTGWQLALRSRNIFGPYEARKVLEQGSTAINGPHQGGLVETPRGEWWFLHFQERGVYGRIVHANPVVWQDDWPLMGVAGADGRREPVLTAAMPDGARGARAAPQTSDEFEAPALSLAWQWQANHQSGWHSLSARPGQLRLAPVLVPDARLAVAPNLLLQKVPARAFRLETSVELASTPGKVRAGMVVAGDSNAALALEATETGVSVALHVDDAVLERHELPRGGPVRARLDFAPEGLCTFAVASGTGEFVALKSSFQAKPGRWIGTKVGLFAFALEPGASEGHADFDYFRFSAP
jgi:beta-xylosidase